MEIRHQINSWRVMQQLPNYLLPVCRFISELKDNYLVLLFVSTTSSLCFFSTSTLWICAGIAWLTRSAPRRWLHRPESSLQLTQWRVWGAAKTGQIKNVNAVSFHITDTKSPGSYSKYFIPSKYFTILQTGEWKWLSFWVCLMLRSWF